MRYAETGVNLEIDLSRGSIERVETDPRLTELHLGGLGTNSRILWDRVPPEVEPFSPDNLLIFSTGLLCGTPAPGANRTIVSTFSPQTLLMAYSMMGGFWAPELKYAGYDKVIVQGRSPNLVYLWVNGDKVEIRDASHLRGKGALETIELIREELKEPKAQGIAIGLAGENRIYFASIETTRGSASRLGVGAVMGDKNLKAIVVRGTKDVFIARPVEFMELCNEVLKYIQYRMNNPLKGIPPLFARVGFPGGLDIVDEAAGAATNFAWGNARHMGTDFWNKEVGEKWREINERVRKRLVSCHNCPAKCAAFISYPKYPNYILKCFTKLTFAVAAMSDLDFSFRINAYTHEYGVDTYTAPQVIAFAIELYEAGILTDQDMPGFPSKTEERFFWLLDKIVRREGIGDVLANGVYRAARQIGRGAEAYDHNTVKKHEQLPIKLEMLNPISFLMLATGEKINITQIEGQIPRAPLNQEEKEEFVKDWVQVPNKYAEKFKQFILDWEPCGEHAFPYYPSVETTCELVDWLETMHYIDDATGICAGLSSFSLKPPYHIHNLPRIVSSATGTDINEDKLWEIARRNRNLLRAINVRRGLRRIDERPPEDHWKRRFPDLETKLLDEYYKFKGWNKEGIPTKKTLHQLGLDHVKEDFERRAIYNEEKDKGN
jgi:aldehyde:ferredoxin oxidoreductase